VRIDVVSIFPEYLDALELSLIGKARQDGLLELNVRNLRDFTTDRHRTVDDTPYGGGAGMVMKPEPWALALEAVLESAGAGAPADGAEPGPDSAADDRRPVLIVPSPAGEVFTQSIAHELAAEQHLVFACGRYEGIDERVLEWAAGSFRVRPMGLGDYVLNGGEVAVLAMVDAIGRLIPGVVGNPESLVEESHADGLLEYPVYTKPSVWRGRAVPEVLLSGNHAKIARFRRDQQLRRTALRRPDLAGALAPQQLTASDQSVLAEAAGRQELHDSQEQ
jgi:tRNA (guanine37-N1)-methyltransferase